MSRFLERCAVMHVACVGGGWYPQSPGGLEKYTYGLARALTRGGDEVSLFVSGNPEPWDARSRVFRIADPQDSLPKRMLSALQSYRRHALTPYDVVNAHFALDTLPLLPFLRDQIPLVIHFHGPWAEESRIEGGGKISVAIKRRIERLVYQRAHRFIVLSSAFKTILHESYGVENERITVIPMGIDCSFFVPSNDRDALRAQLGWPADKMILFTARRLVNRVGVLELVEAAALLKNDGVPILVKIAGKGPLGDELRRSIDRKKLNEVVEVLGFLSEEQLLRAYQAADLTVLPTQHLEGFGTIIAESLACGTPVIGTPVGGIPDALALLDPRLIAQSIAPADIAALVRSIVGGAVSLPQRVICRDHAATHYGWDRVCEQIRTIFGEVAR